LHIGLLGMPGGKTGNCKTVPQVVWPQGFAGIETGKLAGGTERPS
jgi:hypothetical protein